MIIIILFIYLQFLHIIINFSVKSRNNNTVLDIHNPKYMCWNIFLNTLNDLSWNVDLRNIFDISILQKWKPAACIFAFLHKPQHSSYFHWNSDYVILCLHSLNSLILGCYLTTCSQITQIALPLS